jgi:hypothetical protein
LANTIVDFLELYLIDQRVNGIDRSRRFRFGFFVFGKVSESVIDSVLQIGQRPLLPDVLDASILLVGDLESISRLTAV